MGYRSDFLSRLAKLALLFLIIVPAVSRAMTHTILFGGAVGLAYSPNSLTVTVGDTIRWQGDFTFHPLSSTTIPSNATAWHSASGTQFDYPVKSPGVYNYQCDVHFSLGMTGTFTSTPAGMNGSTAPPSPLNLQLLEITPNPALQTQIRIGYGVPDAQKVTLALYNMQGRKVMTLFQGLKASGRYDANLAPDQLASGTYLCRLQGSKTSVQRSVFIIK